MNLAEETNIKIYEFEHENCDYSGQVMLIYATSIKDAWEKLEEKIKGHRGIGLQDGDYKYFLGGCKISKEYDIEDFFQWYPFTYNVRY